MLENRIFPRGAAFGERMWAGPSGRAPSGEGAWIQAERRFVQQRERMAERGIQVRKRFCG